MRRARLGLCIGDREYGDRFTSCLMNHYRDQLELHMFSQKEALQENWKTLDAIVLSDDLAGENRIECEIPQIYLFEGLMEMKMWIKRWKKGWCLWISIRK